MKLIRALAIRSAFGSIGVLFLYVAFLFHHELYAPSWRAAGVLYMAVTGAFLFHQAVSRWNP